MAFEHHSGARIAENAASAWPCIPCHPRLASTNYDQIDISVIAHQNRSEQVKRPLFRKKSLVALQRKTNLSAMNSGKHRYLCSTILTWFTVMLTKAPRLRKAVLKCWVNWDNYGRSFLSGCFASNMRSSEGTFFETLIQRDYSAGFEHPFCFGRVWGEKIMCHIHSVTSKPPYSHLLRLLTYWTLLSLYYSPTRPFYYGFMGWKVKPWRQYFPVKTIKKPCEGFQLNVAKYGSPKWEGIIFYEPLIHVQSKSSNLQHVYWDSLWTSSPSAFLMDILFTH